ncbi:MAG: hypothetical protein V8Q29_00520 [Alistipes shahii]
MMNVSTSGCASSVRVWGFAVSSDVSSGRVSVSVSTTTRMLMSASVR